MNRSSLSPTVERVRAEYLEMPGMKLKIEQVRRLCGVERDVCKSVLDVLVADGFLCVRSDGSYVRISEGVETSRSPAIKAALRSNAAMFRRAG